MPFTNLNETARELMVGITVENERVGNGVQTLVLTDGGGPVVELVP